jgi:phosphate transport system protein
MEHVHILQQYESELGDIRSRIVEMGEKVMAMLATATTALVERNSSLADLTIAQDREINRLEKEIDELCLEVLARWQPTAGDLRFVSFALKLVTDLERIGDKAKNFAKKINELNELPPLESCGDFVLMAQTASFMVQEALDAFVQGNVERALKVCRDDQFVDALNDQIQRILITYMLEDPKAITRALKLLYLSRCLERVADHATNIAEMVVFMVSGKDIRHATAGDSPR